MIRFAYLKYLYTYVLISRSLTGSKKLRGLILISLRLNMPDQINSCVRHFLNQKQTRDEFPSIIHVIVRIVGSDDRMPSTKQLQKRMPGKTGRDKVAGNWIRHIRHRLLSDTSEYT